MLRDPAVVRIGIGGIDADQIMPVAQLVYNAIVHRASLGEHEGSVLCLAELEARHVVGSDILQQRKRLRATHFDFAHVAHVKQSRSCPDRQVFLNDAGIFHRHFPAGKLHHASARGLVSGVERRTPQR